MTRKLSVLAGALAAILVSSITAGAADDVVFTIINKTEGTLERFYTSPVGVKNWEEDVFGDDVLEPGESIKITISDGRRTCKYDLRFEFTDESQLNPLEDSQDICKMSTYTLHQ
jgi:hypothetical protein